MQKSWKTSTLLSLVALLAGVVVFSQGNLEARTQYRSAFQKNYPKVAENNKITCFVCHGKDAAGKMDKEKRNNFGQALGKAIGKKNEKDADAIKAALTKIETEKSAEEGKSFGDLLEAGKLPGNTEE